MTTIRKRITKAEKQNRDGPIPDVAVSINLLEAELGRLWHEGNLIPADEVDARIAEALAARDAEWHRAFHSDAISERVAELLGPHDPAEARTFIKKREKLLVKLERERAAQLADVWAEKGHHDAELIATAIRGADHDG